jgi:hypothetical protein
MSEINKLLVSGVLLVTGCTAASADGSPDEVDPGASDTPGDVASEAVAAMPAPAAQAGVVSGPTIQQGGSSSATPLPASLQGGPGGPGLAVNGGSELGAFVIASYSASTGSHDATAELTVTPTGGASFVYSLIGTGGSYAKRQLRLERTPGSSSLTAASTRGNITCGTVAAGKATTVTLVYRGASQTFDVLLDGSASACTNLPTRIQPPVVGFTLMDASNEGYGGQVQFSDLAVF